MNKQALFVMFNNERHGFCIFEKINTIECRFVEGAFLSEQLAKQRLSLLKDSTTQPVQPSHNDSFCDSVAPVLAHQSALECRTDSLR